MNSRNLLKLFVVFGLSLFGLLIGPIGLAHIAALPDPDSPQPESFSALAAALTDETNQNRQSAGLMEQPGVVPPIQAELMPLATPITGFITLTKQVVGTPLTGLPLTYTIHVTNTSDMTSATNVVISDVIPGGASYISSDHNGTVVGDAVVWNISSILTNTSIAVSFVVTTCQTSLTNSEYKVLTSTEELVSDFGPTVETTLSNPDTEPNFTFDPNPVLINDTVYFTGTANYSETLLSWSWDFGDGQSASGPTVDHTYAASGDYTVILTVTDACGNVHASDPQVVTVHPLPPIIGVSKSATPDPVNFGQTLTYTIVVSNSGGSPITSGVISDTLPANTTFVPASLAITPSNSGTIGSQPPELATDLNIGVGEQLTVTYQVTVSTPVAGDLPIANTVAVTGADSLNRETSATANTNTNVDYQPLLTVTKSSPVVTATVGQMVPYTLTISRAAGSDSSPVNGVSVADSAFGPISCTGLTTLTGSGPWICNFSYMVQPTDTTPIANAVTVQGVDLDNEPVSAVSNIHTLNIDYLPRLSISKDGPLVAHIGETPVFTFTVTNDTPTGDGSPIGAVTVSDSVIGSITNLSSNGDGDSLLEAGESWVYTAGYPITLSTPDPLTNTATVTGTDGNGQPVPAATSNVHSLDIDYQPILTITKTGPASANVGQTVTYTFVVRHALNSDNSPVNSTAVSDNIAGNAVRTSADVGNDGLLSGGEVWTYTASYLIPPSVSDPLVNIGTVTGLDRDGQAIPSASAQHQTAIEYQPRLNITKTGPAIANVGQSVFYTFTVTHPASSDKSPIQNVTVRDNRAGQAGLLDGDTNTNNRLDQNETWRFRVQYTIPPTATDPLSNTGVVTGTDLDGDPVPSASASYSTPIEYAPRLKLLMFGSSTTATVGMAAPYSLHVSHDPATSDRSVITNISVGDSVGTLYAYNGGDSNFNNQLDYGETWIYSGFYIVPPTAPNPLINIGHAQGKDLDGDNVGPVTASTSVPIDYNPAIVIEKTGPIEAQVGQTVVYSFNVQLAQNGDNSPLRNVVVTDSIAGVASYVSGDTNNNNQINQFEIWRFRASYTIPPTTLDPLSNIATVTAKSINSPDTVSSTASHNTFIDFNPRLMITKSGPGVVTVGQNVQYTLQVKHALNSDQSNISGVTVNDPLTGGATRTGGDDGDNILESGETWTYTANYTVKATDPDPLVNSATADGTDRDGQGVPTASIQQSANIDFKPTLSIVSSGPGSVYIGQHAVFTYSVSHNAATSDKTPMNTVSVSDNKAGAAVYVGGDSNSNNLLDFGETWLYNANYIILKTDSSPFNHIGTASAKDKDGQAVPQASGNHSVPISGGPNLLVTKTGPVEVDTGDTISYTITITNASAFPAFNLVITDILPSGVSYLSGGKLVGDSTVEWTEATLPANTSVKFTVTALAADDAVNSQYGVRADGLISFVGTQAVETAVTQFLYLPYVKKGAAELFIWNDNTGGNVTVKLFYVNTTTQVPGTGCTAPNGETKWPCGTFAPGTYNITVTSVCPNQQTISQLFTFGLGEKLIRVFCR